jgi:hypothetical protein
MRRYTDEMETMIKDLTNEYGNDLNSKSISLDGLKAAVKNYSIAATRFHQRLDLIDKTQ